jgi:hypothetical protein
MKNTTKINLYQRFNYNGFKVQVVALDSSECLIEYKDGGLTWINIGDI